MQVDLDFVARMDRELEANTAKKGPWRDWQGTRENVINELRYHVDKLEEALEVDEPWHDPWEPEKVAEYAADVANIAMKAWELWGKK